MSYSSIKASYQRKLIRIIEIDLDYCENVFGESPCNATGTPFCYNTYRTCRDSEETTPKANYDPGILTYKFCDVFIVPPEKDIRPYIKSFNPLPEEISSTLIRRGRINVEFVDEPDYDIGIDKNWDARNTMISEVKGTFWKKLVARNPNFKKKPVRIKEGYEGLSYANYVTTWTGIINNIQIDNGIVRLEAIDSLKTLDSVIFPGTSESWLVADITATQTSSITLTGTTGVDSSGYIWFDNEIISYSGISANVLTGVTRGQFGTMRATHKSGTRVGRVKIFNGNPFSVMVDIINAAGLTLDTASFVEYSNNKIYTDEPNIIIILIENTPLSKIYYELVEIYGCKSWIDHLGRVKLRRDIFYGETGYPQPTYITARKTYNDSDNIIRNSFAYNINEESRITRINFFWNLDIYEVKRTLSGNINNSVTTIGLTSLEGLPQTGEVLIDAEYITYTGLDNSASTITGCTRGARSSTPASHSEGDEVKTTTLSVLRQVTNPENFLNVTQTVDTDAENEYGEAILKTYYARFFNIFNSLPPFSYADTGDYSGYITKLSTKIIAAKRDAQTQSFFELEEKDTDLMLGDFLNLTTKNIEDVDGEGIEDEMYQVVKKEPDYGKAKYTAEKVVSYD